MTMTLTLNGVHIEPNNYYFKDHDYPGEEYDEEAYKGYNNWGMHSLYAKNTVVNLVINGNNSFEAPVVERQMYKIGMACSLTAAALAWWITDRAERGPRWFCAAALRDCLYTATPAMVFHLIIILRQMFITRT